MFVSEVINPLSDASYPARSASYTGTAGAVAEYPPGVQAVLITVTTAAYVTVGEGVTATTASTYVPANIQVKFKVPAGTGAPWRVSAVQVSSTGYVHTKPISLE
jgi:hypothetical protein